VKKITCCYLVHSTSALDVGFSRDFTAKRARYRFNGIWAFRHNMIQLVSALQFREDKFNLE